MPRKTRQKHANYKYVDVVIELTNPCLGGRPASPEQCKEKNVDQLNVFERMDDEITIPARWFEANLRDSARRVNVSGIVAQKYITEFKGSLVNGTDIKTRKQFICPQVKGIPKGRIVNYEMLPRGTQIQTKFDIPTKSVDLELFKKWLKKAGELGIGAYRKGDFGTYKVIEANYSEKS